MCLMASCLVRKCYTVNAQFESALCSKILLTFFLVLSFRARSVALSVEARIAWMRLALVTLVSWCLSLPMPPTACLRQSTKGKSMSSVTVPSVIFKGTLGGHGIEMQQCTILSVRWSCACFSFVFVTYARPCGDKCLIVPCNLLTKVSLS